VAFAHKLSAVLAQPANAEALFVINGDIDLAVSCSADGVHLPERMITSMKKAKELLKIVGCSVHSVDSAVQAAQLGANYIQIGTMFESRTHPGKVPEGVQLLKDVRAAISLESSRAQEVVLIGIGGITVVSVLTIDLCGEGNSHC
jgi:thiamine-phosphate pyrophosphorylase